MNGTTRGGRRWTSGRGPPNRSKPLRALHRPLADSSTNNTSDNTFSGTWYNSGATQVATGPPHNNVLNGNVQVTDGSWPLDAQQVMYEAGIEPRLRTAAPTPSRLRRASRARSAGRGRGAGAVP